MITKFVTEHECMSSILLFGAVSLLLQAMMVLSLKGYVRASANMKTTKKKIMINLKNQFETIYEMGYQIRNTAAYVDKYLLKLKFMGFSFSAWEKAPFLAAGIVSLLAGAEAFYGYMTGMELSAQIEILFAYGVVLVCLFVCFHIFGIKSKKQQIQIQLVDYLENYLANRLLRTKDDVKMLDEQVESALIEGQVKNSEAAPGEEENIEAAAGNMEEDVEMLRQLIRDMDTGKRSDSEKQKRHQEQSQRESSQQIAASHEEQDMEQPELAESEESEIDLLEEFVQSFLA